MEFVLIRGKDDPVGIFFRDAKGTQHIHVGALYLHDGMRYGTKDGVPGPPMAEDDFIAVFQAFPRLLRPGLKIDQIVMYLIRAAHHGFFALFNDLIGMQQNGKPIFFLFHHSPHEPGVPVFLTQKAGSRPCQSAGLYSQNRTFFSKKIYILTNKNVNLSPVIHKNKMISNN